MKREPLRIDPFTLVGRTLRLEPLDAHHAVDLHAVAEPELFRYLTPPEGYTLQDMQAYIADINQLAHMRPLAVVLQGRAIGMTSYMDIRARHRGLEIGWTWIAKAYHGSHVNPEMKYLLLGHAFDVLEVIRVQLKTDSRNIQSQKAIEKLGARYEGKLRNHYIMVDGHLRDTMMYSILPDEWPAVKAKLEERLGGPV